MAALVEEEAVAAVEGGQRADRLQRLHLRLQLLATQAQALLDGTAQAWLQLLQTLAEQGQLAARMLGGKAPLQALQLAAGAFHTSLQGTSHALLQIVQTLGLLLQALTRMAQAPQQAVQPQAAMFQLAGQAQVQTALQAVEALAQRAAVRGQQLGSGGGGRGAHV